jgi:hypothetical protein
VTLDSGLARVAAIHGVAILNIHELSNALRSVLVPGEHVSLRLVRRGEQAQQAVGYLPDGTMIVAEDGGQHVGKDVELVVVSSLQTSAGRMIFARLVQGLGAPQSSTEPRAADRDVEPVAAARPEPVAAALAGTVPVHAPSHAPGSSNGTPGGSVLPVASTGSSMASAPPEAVPAPGPRAEAPTEPAPAPAQPARPARSPFPPRPPASPRQGTPRNPRR